ncbi:MAG: MFS transporter [Anaerolineae bacterium]|nr:MFS transporter [Anaerolineae bacterium]
MTCACSASASECTEREIRRAFALGVFNGAVFQFGESLIDPSVVLTWFVSRLTASNVLIGLVAPLGDAGWFLPQLFFSGLVQRMERKMPVYRLFVFVRVATWAVLAAMVWLVEEPHLLLAMFFFLYAIARLASGPSGLAFFDIVARAIPPQRRGSFFGWRQLLGGILGLGGGWVVRRVLNCPSLPFPHGHATLFGLYTLALTLALGSFTFVREPPGQAQSWPGNAQRRLAWAVHILVGNGAYRNYLLARTALILAGAAVPFYTVYARNVLGAAEGMAGVYVSARLAAQLLSNLPWGRLGDQRGNRLVMKLLASGSALTPVLALVLMGTVAAFRPQGAWLPYLALPIFLMDGLMRPAHMLAGSNFLLEMAPERERPLYLGLSNSLLGVVILLSGFGGLVVDWAGFAGLFALSAALSITGYLLVLRLPEPREEHPV